MFIVTAAFEFHETDRVHKYSLPIHVAQMTLDNRSLPSIMGWDLLNAFRLLVDRLNGTVTLDPHLL